MVGIITLLSVPLIGGASPAPRTSAPEDSAAMTLVVVENDRRVPATVYLERGNEDIRLGVVGAFGDGTLRIPDYLADGEARFFVEPAGQIDESTGSVDIERGTHVGLVIPER
jgi:hypothetical protein